MWCAPRGSILGPLLFLIYVNDMPCALKYSELFLSADDSCIVFQSRDINSIQEKLTHDFSEVCDWFIDNKLSTHFGEDKTKCIPLGSKHNLRKIENFDIKYDSVVIKRHSAVSYLGCVLDKTLSGENMASSIITKVKSRGIG